MCHFWKSRKKHPEKPKPAISPVLFRVHTYPGGGFSLSTLSSADGSDVSVMNVMVFTVEQSWDGALCCTGQSC